MGGMSRVAVVNHNRELGLGRLQPHLTGHDVVEVWASDADFPDDVDSVVVMGGFMSAYDVAEHPWLEDEKRWMAKQVEAGVPVLGICLGAQLLADCLGGRAYLAPVPEVGVVEIELTPEGERHPVVSHIGEAAFFAHEDTFDPPPGAVMLARTEAYPTAFELGSALAIQCHPEVPAADAVVWAEDPRFDMLERAGVSPAEFVAGIEAADDRLARNADRLFTEWFRTLDPSGGIHSA